MKTLTMTEFRSSPGERIIDVIRERETFIITKAGKPVAKLGPIDETTVIESNGRIRGELPLTMRRPELVTRTAERSDAAPKVPAKPADAATCARQYRSFGHDWKCERPLGHDGTCAADSGSAVLAENDGPCHPDCPLPSCAGPATEQAATCKRCGVSSGLLSLCEHGMCSNCVAVDPCRGTGRR